MVKKRRFNPPFLDYLFPTFHREIYSDKPILHSVHHDNTERQNLLWVMNFWIKIWNFGWFPIKIDVYHLSLPTVTIIYNCITIVLLRR